MVEERRHGRHHLLRPQIGKRSERRQPDFSIRIVKHRPPDPVIFAPSACSLERPDTASQGAELTAVESLCVPQRDIFHDAVKRALIKDGWTITHDPLLLAFGATNVYVDLGAELPIAAEKDGRRIAVEVKSFLGTSEVTDLERALGQHALYRALLRRQDPERRLYVAIPKRAFDTFVGLPETLSVVKDEGIRLIVFDAAKEVLITWVE